VNRRLAAHRRKELSVVETGAATTPQEPSTRRAAQAAARVAERYAHVPSYSEMQASEARSALRAAEAATRVALEAQVAAQAALDNLAEEHERLDEEQAAREYRTEPAVSTSDRVGQSAQSIPASGQSIHIQWEPDMPVFYDPAEAAARSPQPTPHGRRDHLEPSFDGMEDELSIALVDPAAPINANLIQFPRELVATRRVRPRIAGTYPASAEHSTGQLSIFEVDPDSISTTAAPPTSEASSAGQVSGPEWSGMKLDAQAENRREPHPQATTARPRLEHAPLSLRLMAVAIDAALIVGLVCIVGTLLAAWLSHFPSMRTAEVAAFAGLVVVAALYHLFFFMQVDGTPGMRYAHIALCTFDDENPTRDQLRSRLVAMLLSVLPVGLGVAWALFDEDHLSWHDRISGTYLRAY